MAEPNTLPTVKNVTSLDRIIQCSCCKRMATLCIGIGRGIMSGGVKLHYVCGIHHDMAKQNMAKFLAHNATKGTYAKEMEVRGGNAIHNLQKHTWKQTEADKARFDGGKRRCDDPD